LQLKGRLPQPGLRVHHSFPILSRRMFGCAALRCKTIKSALKIISYRLGAG
jgi:hypothetical protein